MVLIKGWFTSLEEQIEDLPDTESVAITVEALKGLLRLIPETVVLRIGDDVINVTFRTPDEQRSGRNPEVTAMTRSKPVPHVKVDVDWHREQMGTHSRRKIVVASTKRQLRTLRAQLVQLELRVRDLESAVKILFRITKARH